MFIAVESGDLVHSTKMSPTQYADAISALKDELAQQHAVFDTDYEIFRGDAFQVIYNVPKEAIYASLMTKLKLLHVVDGYPIYITQAIAFGLQADKTDSLAENMGMVFIASGRLLDRTKRRQLAIEYPSHQAAINVIQTFLNHHINSLTQKQAQVLYHYLRESFPEQQLIADKLNITRQNVAAHLKRGGADLLKQTIEFFDTTCKDLPL